LLPLPTAFPSAWDHDNPTYASHIVWKTFMYHHAQLVGWDGFSLMFYLNCPQTTVLLISASQVAGITNASHCAQSMETFCAQLLPSNTYLI
jgi:hypothetical protein